MAQGVGILGMLCLHLFCRTGDLPYTPTLWVGNLPLIYYIGLFGDLCVPVFCFSSGYAQSILYENNPKGYLKTSCVRVLQFIKHFWIIICLFSVLGLMIGHDAIPGSISAFIGNIFLVKLSYNGAWWFVVTYLFLIAMTVLFRKLQNKFSPILVLLGSGMFYFISYVFRFVLVLEIPNKLLAWIWNQIILFGTSQFSYIVGMVFHKNSIVSRLKNWQQKHPHCCNFAIIILPVAMFLLHCAEPSLIIAPITGLVTLMCFHLWKKPMFIKQIFVFLGNHSANLWLVHMFFYMTMFPHLIFTFPYPLASLLILLLVCILTSYIINGIEAVIGILTSRSRYRVTGT